MIILGLDYETTGFDPVTDRVIEVGLALWDVERRKPISQRDFYVKPEIEIPQEKWDEVTPIHGITKEDVEKYGIPDHKAWELMSGFISKADAIVAHNGTMFDKNFYEAWCARYLCQPLPTLWVDTRLDVPEPMTGSLVCIAAKKGFLNPFPHQALSDVLTMLKILEGYDIAAVIERAKIPNILIQMIVPFESKDHAKELGYYWEPYPLKEWRKAIKLCDLEKERDATKFKVLQVEEFKNANRNSKMGV